MKDATMSMDEEVLVCPSETFDSLGRFCGFSSAVERYLPSMLASESLQFLARSKAETDPTFKQLIPYAVLRCGDRYFCYSRSKTGTEQRLHDRLSLGIGGHICREDGDFGDDVYSVGYARELAEEVRIDCDFTDRIIGLVHDDRTPVGEVHVGVVHLLELAEPAAEPKDPALADAAFLHVDDVLCRRDCFESWSSLVLDHLLNDASGRRSGLHK